MKRSFSLLEIIIVVVVISIITTYFLTKSEYIIDESIKIKIKSDIAMIRDSITKKNSSSILLGNNELDSLDEESLNKINSKLFSNILDIPLQSSNLEEKRVAFWIKTKINEYRVYVSNEVFLDFEFKNDTFLCNSSLDICKEFE